MALGAHEGGNARKARRHRRIDGLKARILFHDGDIA
jgi:hypothetical protein